MTEARILYDTRIKYWRLIWRVGHFVNMPRFRTEEEARADAARRKLTIIEGATA